MEYPLVFAINFAAVVIMMLAGWALSLANSNVTILDSLWGMGVVLIAWLSFLLADGFRGRKLLICLLVSSWSFRLTTHLTLRNH